MERRLAVILAADVVGYSRLMEADEEATVRTLSTGSLVTQFGTVMKSRCSGTNPVWLTPLRHGRYSAAPLSKSLL